MFLSRKLPSTVSLGEDFQVYLPGLGWSISVLYCAGLIAYCYCNICNLFELSWWVAKAIVEIVYSR